MERKFFKINQDNLVIQTWGPNECSPADADAKVAAGMIECTGWGPIKGGEVYDSVTKTTSPIHPAPKTAAQVADENEIARLKDLSVDQWSISDIASWLKIRG